VESFHRFDQLLELRVSLFEVVDQRLDVIDFVERFVEITMPQEPFQPLDLLANLLTKRLITVHQTFAVLGQAPRIGGLLRTARLPLGPRQRGPIGDVRAAAAYLIPLSV
jgi:hypothetical protein